MSCLGRTAVHFHGAGHTLCTATCGCTPGLPKALSAGPLSKYARADENFSEVVEALM